MKPKIVAVTLFLLAVVSNLLSHIYLWDTVDYISKPLLLPTLMVYLFFSVTEKSRLVKYLLLAMGLSWLGDVLLMFQPVSPIFFILGLGSFLLAHIAYITVFRGARGDDKPKAFTFGTAFLLIVYGFLLMIILWPGLNDLKIPVVLYTLVIITMGISALFRKAEGASMVLIGAFLFIASDSMIAVDKFYEPITAARFWIMSTYILAQFMIVAGMIRYFVKVQG